MKNNYVLFSVLIFLIVILIFGLIFMAFIIQRNNERNICETTEVLELETFSLSQHQAEYPWVIEHFSKGENVGEVNDMYSAIEKAKELWLDKYKADISGYEITVAFDQTEECWYICAQKPDVDLGGAWYALIRTNGEVIAAWPGD